jgi:hypothetical protein
MEIKNAKIIKIGELQTFANDFTKVDFVVETQEQYPQTQEQYPQKIQLEAIKDKADNLIQYNKVGDIVDVAFNIRGREWVNPQGETKYFNSLQAWKVFKADKSNESTSQDQQVVTEPF